MGVFELDFMNKPLRAVIILICLAFVSGALKTNVSRASELTVEAEAANRVNFADRQRMLTQQIARNACFVMANIDPERFAAKTETAVRQFDTALKGLRYGDANLGLFAETRAEVLAHLTTIEELWATFGPASRQIAAGDMHPVPMMQLIGLNLETRKHMNDAVGAIRSGTGKVAISEDLARTIDIAGRQRMLSQQASKELCFTILRIDGAGASGQLDKTVAAFDVAMQRLLEGAPEDGIVPPPNRQVKKQLERTARVWKQFKDVMNEFSTNPDLPDGDRVMLANMSDQVLREMDLAVKMYAP